LRFPGITAENLRRLASGTDTNVRVFHQVSDDRPSSEKVGANLVAPAAAAGRSADPRSGNHSVPASTLPPLDHAVVIPASVSDQLAAGSAGPAAQLHFSPENIKLKAGDSTTVGLAISGVNDLFSLPLLLKYDPAVIEIQDVQDGGFLSGGTQAVAIVQTIDGKKGEAVISCTRRQGTSVAAAGQFAAAAGGNGSGTILGIVVRAVGHGESKIQILEVKAQDSQQHAVPVVTGEATVRVP
jgi:general secretion pathway protein D